MRIIEETSELIRIEPGNDQRAAIFTTMVLGVIMAGCTLFSGQGYEMTIVFAVVSSGFFMAAYLVYNQQRSVEVNLSDSCFYVFGRQPTDMYYIPFHQVACIRVSSRVNKRRRGAREQEVERFYLDIVRRDGGYETLERSADSTDVAQLAGFLSEKTGLELLDNAGIGCSRKAEISYAPLSVTIPENPSPHSVVQKRQSRKSAVCAWTLSPGSIALILMGGVGFGLMLIGMIGIAELSTEGGNIWAGTVTALVAGFFAYQVSWRIMRGVLCTGYVSLNFDGLHAGQFCLNAEHERLSVPFDEIVSFRVVAPRYSHARWEAVTLGGEIFVLAKMLPGLAPLTLGDMHWLNAYYSKLLSAGAYRS